MSLKSSGAYFMSEFLCTMLLVMCTCLGCYVLENAHVPLSATYGLITMVLIHCFGSISGGYANPAVCLALCVRGCLSIKRFLIYTVAEISGGMVGHYAANKLLGKSPADALCSFGPSAGLPDMNIMGTEFLLTFLLVMSWCVLWDYEGEMPMAWYLAAVNALVCLLGGYLTGASTNPARTLAPAFFMNKPERMQVCIGGQLLAAIVAPLLWSQLENLSKS